MFSREAVARLHTLLCRVDKLYQECRVFPISASAEIPQPIDFEEHAPNIDTDASYFSDSSESDYDLNSA